MADSQTQDTTRLSINTLLGPKGPLARTLPGFVPRSQQVALARGVEASLSEGRACLAEAGTGVGKTVAYLVPLMRWLHRNEGKRAIVSTHTLALQTQLVERDVPNLLAALAEWDIRAAVMKGRGNYVCLQDLEAASGDLLTGNDPQFRQIQRWASESDSGDIAELDFTFAGWPEIAANVDTCRGRECRFYDRCFYYKARKAADDSNLLIVNHALFFTDLRLRRIAPGIPHLLPAYDAVVFDEAHHVEDMATRAFGLEWGSRRVPQLLHRLRRVEGIDADRLQTIDGLHTALLAPFEQAAKAEAFLDEAIPDGANRDAFTDLRDELCGHLNTLNREITRLADAVDAPADRDRLQGLGRLATRVSTELKQVTRPAGEPGGATPVEGEGDDNWFRWYHTRKLRNGQTFSTLVKTPLSISTLLRESLFAQTPRSLLVSATLATGGGFEYLRDRLGLTDDPLPAKEGEEAAFIPAPVEVREGSPFDFEQNCLLYIPRALSAPPGGGAGDGYTDLLTGEVLALINAAGGRTFVLFTSNRMLKAVYDRLWGACDFPLFQQGEMPNGRLVEAFVGAGNGVLLGTNSFWEGVDVPGPALSCVIMDKLPFAAPDSPTQRAREEHIRKAGGDSFRQLSIPLAQMRLKQGFGRLLRTVSDRGVVAILDSRLRTKGYGHQLLRDLPPCPRTDDIADVVEFFAPAPPFRPDRIPLAPK